MELVFAGLLGFVALEEYDSAALVTSREVVAGLVEFDGGYYVGLSNIFYITLITEAPIGKQSVHRSHFISLRNVCNAQNGGGRTA